MLKKNEHHSILLQNSYNKHGVEQFQFNVLAILEEGELLSTEQRLLEQMSMNNENHYNVSKHAVAFMRGRSHSEKTKKTMSEQRMGNKYCIGRIPWNKGIKCPDDTRSKISKSKQYTSQETRDKMSAAKIGFVPHNKGSRRSVCFRGHQVSGENAYHVKKRNTFACRACSRINSLKTKEKKEIF